MEQITTKHYAELVAKARAHDVYLAAIARVQARARRITDSTWRDVSPSGVPDAVDGYNLALADIQEAILDEDAKLDSRPAK